MKTAIKELRRARSILYETTEEHTAINKAIQVMEAWMKLRLELKQEGSAWSRSILRSMDWLVPPELVDELDQLREWLGNHRDVNVIHCGQQALDAEIARIKAARKS